MSCCELEYKFLSVPTNSRLPSRSKRFRSTIPTHHRLGIQQAVAYLASDAGWNTVHQQQTCRSSSRIIHTRYRQWLPGRYLQIREACKVGPAPRLLAAYVPVRGYDHLQGERIRSSSGRPLLYQTASHHIIHRLRRSSPDQQQRRHSVQISRLHFIDVPDARSRRLLAGPPSETCHNHLHSHHAETSATISRGSTGHPLCSTARRSKTW
jgi:hypothetical protein